VGASGGPHAPAGNRLLDGLPREVYERIQARLESVTLAPDDVVYEPNRPIPHVLFPTGCVVSLAAVMDDGTTYELTTVGREGMVGLPVFLGTETAPYRASAQVPGAALRLEAAVFCDAIETSVTAARLLHRFSQVLFNQVAWSSACARAHSIEQRCARWLLMTHDRVGAGQLLLTQEFLARMMGVRRAGVNEAASALQRAGLISYSWGRVDILDRTGLEAASCECYRHIRGEYNRLMT
jgi:CRP-like cAMP-binding protein